MKIIFKEDVPCDRCNTCSPAIDLIDYTTYPYNSVYLCSTCMDILADELRERSNEVADDQARRRGEIRNGK